MSDPTTQNNVAQLVNNAVAILMKDGETAAKAFILTEVPFLTNPITQFFLDMALNWLAKILDHNIEMAITSAIIDIQTKHENSQVYQALNALMIAQKSGDTNAIDSAIKNAKDKWANAIHWDGSANTNVVN